MDNQILIILCIFAAMALLGYVAFMLLSDKDVSGRLRNRLVGKAKTDITKPTGPKGVVPLLQKMGQAAAQPFMPKTREAQSDLRKRLGYAGIYSNSAIKAVTGAKVICLGVGLIGGYIGSLQTEGFLSVVMCLSVGGLVGYLLPTFWLRQAIKKN